MDYLEPGFRLLDTARRWHWSRLLMIFGGAGMEMM